MDAWHTAHEAAGHVATGTSGSRQFSVPRPRGDAIPTPCQVSQVSDSGMPSPVHRHRARRQASDLLAEYSPHPLLVELEPTLKCPGSRILLKSNKTCQVDFFSPQPAGAEPKLPSLGRACAHLPRAAPECLPSPHPLELARTWMLAMPSADARRC